MDELPPVPPISDPKLASLIFLTEFIGAGLGLPRISGCDVLVSIVFSGALLNALEGRYLGFFALTIGELRFASALVGLPPPLLISFISLIA